MKKIVVLSGAGMSADSGIKTFRDEDGLWEGHDVMEVATPEGFMKNPGLVLDFYNQRRRQLKEVAPNAGHLSLLQLQEGYEVSIVTQNVDDLHERAGNTSVLHLHGELRKVRPIDRLDGIRYWEDDLHLGDTDERGVQLRPHIVWFGEAVPMIDRAVMEVAAADAIIVVGTSMQVYPAAGLVGYAPEQAPVYYVDPNPTISYELGRRDGLELIQDTAAKGLVRLVDNLLQAL